VVSNAHAFAYRCLNEPGWPNEYASGYALELTGHPPEDLLAGEKVRFGDLIVEEDRARVWEEVQRALAEGRGFELEYALRRRDGQIRHVRDYGHGLYGKGSEVVALEGLVYDVTELVETEEGLRKSEERFRSLVQNASEIILVVDGDKVVRYASPALTRVLGDRPEDVLGDDAFRVLHPDDMAQVRDVIASATEKPGTAFGVELRLRHADGSWRHMESTCTSLLEDPAIGGCFQLPRRHGAQAGREGAQGERAAVQELVRERGGGDGAGRDGRAVAAGQPFAVRDSRLL
jgi:PAS domain S-box-containing protein